MVFIGESRSRDWPIGESASTKYLFRWRVENILFAKFTIGEIT